MTAALFAVACVCAFTLGRLSAPRPTRRHSPDALTELWFNVHQYRATNGQIVTGCSSLYGTPERADEMALEERIARISTAGEWTPCAGRRVLA